MTAKDQTRRQRATDLIILTSDQASYWAEELTCCVSDSWLSLTDSFLAELSGVHDTGSGHASLGPSSLWPASLLLH